jgi:hypothetical protein
MRARICPNRRAVKVALGGVLLVYENVLPLLWDIFRVGPATPQNAGNGTGDTCSAPNTWVTQHLGNQERVVRAKSPGQGLTGGREALSAWGQGTPEDLLRICCVSCRRMPGNADPRARSYRYLTWADERNSFVSLQGRQVGEL